MKSTRAQAKALLLKRIQMLESRRSGRAINNGAIPKLEAHHSMINLEKRGTVCTPKKGKQGCAKHSSPENKIFGGA